MKALIIGAAGHIGTYLIPMLVNAGYDTVAITRTMTPPYEDAPAWHTVKRELLDRENTPDFIHKLRAMEPDVIVDLVNFDVKETKKSWRDLRAASCPTICTALPVGLTEWRRRFRLTRTICARNLWTITGRTSLRARCT